MLKSYSIWGRDNFKIIRGNSYFIADKSIIDFQYVPEPTEIVDTWSGETIYINQKYREVLNVEIKQFLNNNWYSKLSNLVKILIMGNYTIYPFYEPTHYNQTIVLNNPIWTNKLNFKQLVNILESGQSVKLTFKGRIPIKKENIVYKTNKLTVSGYPAGRLLMEV